MAIFKICTDEIPGRKIFPNLKKKIQTDASKHNNQLAKF